MSLKLSHTPMNEELSLYSAKHDLLILTDELWNCLKIHHRDTCHPLAFLEIGQPFIYLSPSEKNHIESLLLWEAVGTVHKEIPVFLGNKSFSINLLISLSDAVFGGYLIRADYISDEEILKGDEEFINSHFFGLFHSLEAIEKKYFALLDAMDEGIVMINRNGEFFARNHNAYRIFGADVTKIKNRDSAISFQTEDGKPLKFENLPLLHTLRTGESLHNVKVKYLNAGKDPIWLSINSHPIYYSGNIKNGPDAAVATYSDITSEVEKDEAIQEQNRKIISFSSRIANILNSISHGLIALDKDLKIVLWNKTVENATGISYEQALGKNIQELLPQYIDRKEFRRLKKALREKRTTVTEMYSPQLKIWIETSSHPTEEGMLMYVRNITDSKIRQKIMKLENNLLPYAQSENSDISDILEYFIKNISEVAGEEMIGVAVLINNFKMEIPVAIKGKSGQKIKLLLTEKSQNELYDFLAKNFSQNLVLKNIEECGEIVSALREKSNIDSVVVLNIPIPGNQWKVSLFLLYNSKDSLFSNRLSIIQKPGEILGTVLSGKLSYRNLIQANELYYLSSLATKDWLYDWNLENNRLFWNQAFFDSLGYKRSPETENVDFWLSIIHEEDRQRVKKRTYELLNSFARSQVIIGEYRMRTINGEYRLVYDRGYLMFNEKGVATRMVGAVQDITEQRKLHEKLIEEKVKHQQLMARAVLDAQEHERMEIGKELHDNVNQILSTVRLYLDLEKTGKKLPFDLIERSSELINSAITEIRNLSRTLIQPSINDIGLEQAVKELLNVIELSGKLKVQLVFDKNIESFLNRQQKLNIFRIIQEQLNNVMKHAHAKKLFISVKKEKNSVSLTVSDDGIGCDLNNIGHDSGVGLSNIYSRAELFNGSVKITTAPGSGFSLNVFIPISYK